MIQHNSYKFALELSFDLLLGILHTSHTSANMSIGCVCMWAGGESVKSQFK